jgi:hypothetical protein
MLKSTLITLLLCVLLSAYTTAAQAQDELVSSIQELSGLSGTEDGSPLQALITMEDLDLDGDETLGTESGGTTPPAPGPAVPVDGGLSLLLAAGAAYGARRLHKAKAGKKRGCKS